MCLSKTDMFGKRRVVLQKQNKKAPAAASDSAKLKGYKHKYWLFILIMI